MNKFRCKVTRNKKCDKFTKNLMFNKKSYKFFFFSSKGFEKLKSSKYQKCISELPKLKFDFLKK